MARDSRNRPATSYPASNYAYQPGAYPAQPVYASSARPGLRLPIILLTLAVVGLCLLPLAAALGMYGYFQIFEVIAPNVRVGEVDLTWMNISEAAAEINTRGEVISSGWRN